MNRFKLTAKVTKCMPLILNVGCLEDLISLAMIKTQLPHGLSHKMKINCSGVFTRSLQRSNNSF